LRLQLHSVPPCVAQRYVALCFGGRWHEACIEAPALPAAGTHGALYYHHILWVKWRLLRVALATPPCTMVLFIEADVVLYRNPFAVISGYFGTSLDGIDMLYSASARVLRSLRKDPQAWSGRCERGLSNTGIVLLRSLRLVDAVLREEPWAKIPGTPLDQVLVDRMLTRAGAKWRSCLLPETFATYCFTQEYGSDDDLWCNAALLHATCCERQKLNLVKASILHVKTARCGKPSRARGAKRRRANATLSPLAPRSMMSPETLQLHLTSTEALAQRLNISRTLHKDAITTYGSWCADGEKRS